MAKYKFNAKLNTKSLMQLKYDLEHYAEGTLPTKCEKFIQKLAERGIEVAYNSTDATFKPCVEFTYKFIDKSPDETTGMMIGKTIKFIHRVWYDSKGSKVVGEYDISPLAMAEFGAGWYAETNPWGLPSTRGSLGDNGKRDVWFWYDSNGVKHSSEEDYTINPTHPMYMAFQQMRLICEQVAHEVFG